jgi:amino acid transporter
VLCAAINLAVGLALANHMEVLTTMVSFGALIGFLTLHLSVIVHFMWRQKSKDWLRHCLVPLVGFAIIAYTLINMAMPAKIAGIIWLMVGVVVLSGLSLTNRHGKLLV